MAQRSNIARARLFCGSALASLTLWASAAAAQEAEINIPPQSLASALYTFAGQSGHQVMFSPDLTGAKTTAGVSGVADREQALRQLLAGSGLTYQREDDTFLIVRASDPQSGSAAGDGADQGTVQALIVTAQKREENIQDVPIAMSAFTQEALERSQVAGGPDLMTQVPNMTFTKTNFSSYSIQLRGIGTQAISATTDAAVAVAFNNTPFIRNRFFEQEFYDLQRVEVLRGPQGTLYGRNATAGVVNLISEKPKFAYEARLSADVANYNSTRLEGMINVPLVEDKVALRLAGAWTKREGYDTNQITGNQIDGRDLWSTRLSLRFEPTDNIHANLIWEHFQEDDDRLRSGKQLCHTHEVAEVAGIPTPDHFQTLIDAGFSSIISGVQPTFSQGCMPASLYAPGSFETPNGLSLPYYVPASAIGLPIALTDPYISRTQSHDLRTIESTVDPHYQAKSDVVELQLGFDLGDNLTLTSETGYSSDFIFSTEDYNRFATASGAFRHDIASRPGAPGPGGVFCDPQVGCADRLVAVDLSTANSRQFSQEMRISSNFGGAFNFSLGANYLRYDTEDKYYVFVNSLTLLAASSFGSGIEGPYVPNQSDNSECLAQGYLPPDFNKAYEVSGCVYIDPNPISGLNDLGHNYFLSRNPYKLISYALFGEAYYNITDNLKLTAGLRWTYDKKEAPKIPSWLLATDTVGYSIAGVETLEWREPTGRLALDWKPDLSFTDQTLLYASFAHGYKAGGANPPPAGLVMYGALVNQELIPNFLARAAAHPPRFDPEFVNAFELGAKNQLLGETLTLNADVFYYDYKGYQVSQIIDRSAINFNFDAKVWGLELETDWRPIENLRLGLKFGYENTRVANGMKAIDVMDRTAGQPGWVVVRPFPTFPSNCVLPSDIFLSASSPSGLANVGGKSGGKPGGCEIAYILNHDPVTDAPYVDLTTVTGDIQQGDASTLFAHPGYTGWDPATAPNHGEGFYKDLSGHELPNAPHVTTTLTADYTIPLPHSWLATLHTDLYYQSEAWTRIFNTPGYDKLKAYTNVNLAAIFTNEDAGWKVMAYVKNVFDRDSITGAFLNSDDTGLTTNVFLTEPRLFGLRVTKDWTGEGWWTGANPNHTGPYPLTVELAGQVQRLDAHYQPVAARSFAGLDPRLQAPASVQNRDFDKGDDRLVKLTYQPQDAVWSVSIDYRGGRNNNDTAYSQAEFQVVHEVCAYPEGSFTYELICVPGAPLYDVYPTAHMFPTTDSSSSSVGSRERHTVADLQVARHLAVPEAVGKSQLALGLRYAEFSSATRFGAQALSGWYLPAGWAFTPVSYNSYKANVDFVRRFKGAGPMLSWSASKALLGSEETGRVAAEWSAAAGALFGEQKASAGGLEQMQTHTGMYNDFPSPIISQTTVNPLPSRSKFATVPVVDLSLGVAYEVGRIKLGTGYHWERYFNAIDAGYLERKEYDRTIDGPYFKIAVGFGG